MPSTPIISNALVRPLQLITRVMQWCSAVIVMGITSYFINRGPKGQHIIYQEVIVRANPHSVLGLRRIHTTRYIC